MLDENMVIAARLSGFVLVIVGWGLKMTGILSAEPFGEISFAIGVIVIIASFVAPKLGIVEKEVAKNGA